MRTRADLELSQLKLQHVLTEGLNKHSREKLGVGLHLREKHPLYGMLLHNKTTLSQ